MAKSEKDKRIAKHLRKMAKFTRLEFEGYTKKEIRAVLLEWFREYSDGETAQLLTVFDLKELAKLKREQIVEACEKMVEMELIVETDKIPDYHQYGDHDERAFILNVKRKIDNG